MKCKAFVFVLSSLLYLSCKTSKEDSIIIAAAANMQYVMGKLIQTFQTKTGVECELVISSSGKLTAQIIEGAPYDIFVSADIKYPNEIFKKGLSLEQPKIYAYGKLVLWTANDTIFPSMSMLTNKDIKHIATANPRTAPYGKAAEDVLNRYGLVGAIAEKLVYGESIAQVNQFIVSKSAEIGFTSKSTVLSHNLKNKGDWVEINQKYYSPIAQAVILLNGEKSAKAQLFYEFLFSEEAKEILKKFGYSVDEL